jgi:hypothetical protein
VGGSGGASENPEWFLGDISAFDEWVIGEEHPSDDLRRIVGSWIASLPDRPWQHPSVPFGDEGRPRYDRRGARIQGVASRTRSTR